MAALEIPGVCSKKQLEWKGTCLQGLQRSLGSSRSCCCEVQYICIFVCLLNGGLSEMLSALSKPNFV